jgi:hypothetical protein
MWMILVSGSWPGLDVILSGELGRWREMNEGVNVTVSWIGKQMLVQPGDVVLSGEEGIKTLGRDWSMDPYWQPGPKRLFASTSHSIIPSKSFGNLQTIGGGGKSTKTPAKVSRPAALKQFTTPLPSASKPRRSRQSLTPLPLPLLAPVPAPQFTTPARKEWEEGDSLESITEGLNELAVLGLGQIGEVEEDDGDIEYMPPRSEREFLVRLFEEKLEPPKRVRSSLW